MINEKKSQQNFHNNKCKKKYNDQCYLCLALVLILYNALTVTLLTVAIIGKYFDFSILGSSFYYFKTIVDN